MRDVSAETLCTKIGGGIEAFEHIAKRNGLDFDKLLFKPISKEWYDNMAKYMDEFEGA